MRAVERARREECARDLNLVATRHPRRLALDDDCQTARLDVDADRDPHATAADRSLSSLPTSRWRASSRASEASRCGGGCSPPRREPSVGASRPRPPPRPRPPRRRRRRRNRRAGNIIIDVMVIVIIPEVISRVTTTRRASRGRPSRHRGRRRVATSRARPRPRTRTTTTRATWRSPRQRAGEALREANC